MSSIAIGGEAMAGGLLEFDASNITGTSHVGVQVDRGLSVRAVTESIADRMALPDSVPWALRDSGSSAYLDDDGPIGDQLKPGSRVTITPKTHLGGGRRIGG
jgi:hypothetical protein